MTDVTTLTNQELIDLGAAVFVEGETRLEAAALPEALRVLRRSHKLALVASLVAKEYGHVETFSGDDKDP